MAFKGKIETYKNKSRDFLSRFMVFILYKVWHKEAKGIQRIVRIFSISVRGFIKDNIAVRASALTFYTLLSIVPVIALAFAIAKGFGLDERLSDFIRSSLSGQKEVADYLMQFSSGMLENAKGGLIAGIGVIMLLYSVFKLLNNIEEAFNFMWHTQASRPLLRKVTDYVSIMTFAPILLLISLSANVFITTMLQNFLTGYLSPVLKVIINCTPFVVLWVVFTLVYLIMPNTKVNFLSALISGIIMGTVFEIVQWGYFSLQVGASKAGAIYGSFAALPLFLTWMQIAWIIVLVGCELCYSIQNVNQYSVDNEKISRKTEKQLAVFIMMNISKSFADDKKKLNDHQWAEQLAISPKLFNRICDKLVSLNLLNVINNNENEEYRYFAPAIDINLITANKVCEKIEEYVAPQKNPYLVTLISSLEKIPIFKEILSKIKAEEEKNNSVKIPDSKAFKKVEKELENIKNNGCLNCGNIILKDLDGKIN